MLNQNQRGALMVLAEKGAAHGRAQWRAVTQSRLSTALPATAPHQ